MIKNNFLNRNSSIFKDDLERIKDDLSHLIGGSRILVIGAAGTIGQSVFYELFSRKPKSIHAVDISENNLVELVRTIRSSPLDQSPELKTYAIDYGSNEFKFLNRDNKNSRQSLYHPKLTRDNGLLFNSGPFRKIDACSNLIFQNVHRIKKALDHRRG